MHLLGTRNVMIHANDAHNRPETVPDPSRSRSGLGKVVAVANDLRVGMVDRVPRLSLAQLNLTLGIVAWLFAIERDPFEDEAYDLPSPSISLLWTS